MLIDCVARMEQSEQKIKRLEAELASLRRTVASSAEANVSMDGRIDNVGAWMREQNRRLKRFHDRLNNQGDIVQGVSERMRLMEICQEQQGGRVAEMRTQVQDADRHATNALKKIEAWEGQLALVAEKADRQYGSDQIKGLESQLAMVRHDLRELGNKSGPLGAEMVEIRAAIEDRLKKLEGQFGGLVPLPPSVLDGMMVSVDPAAPGGDREIADCFLRSVVLDGHPVYRARRLVAESFGVPRERVTAAVKAYLGLP